MKIFCKSDGRYNLPANLMVNKVGKYLKKTIDSAYKLTFSSNMCDVFMVIYFQKPIYPDRPGDGVTWGDLQEMHIDLNLTTYQNKVRVNILEISPEERTIGHDVFLPESLADLKQARWMILQQVEKRISKAYEHYQFIF